MSFKRHERESESEHHVGSRDQRAAITTAARTLGGGGGESEVASLAPSLSSSAMTTTTTTTRGREEELIGRDERDRERWAKLKRLKQAFHVKRRNGKGKEKEKGSDEGVGKTGAVEAS